MTDAEMRQMMTKIQEMEDRARKAHGQRCIGVAIVTVCVELSTGASLSDFHGHLVEGLAEPMGDHSETTEFFRDVLACVEAAQKANADA